VYGLVNIMQNQHGNEKNPQQTEEFQISICSHVLTAEGLRQLLHAWVKEYENHLNADRHLRYFYLKNNCAFAVCIFLTIQLLFFYKV
jgi:hypothetical protein